MGNGIKCKKKSTTDGDRWVGILKRVAAMMVSLRLPEGQPGFRLQEEELQEEACCWFSKDALTVPCFKSPSLYIHAIQRVSVWGVGEWGRRGAEPVFHAEVRRPPPHGAKRDRKTPSGLGPQGEGPSTTTNPAPDTSLTSTGHYFLPRNDTSRDCPTELS